MDRNPKWFNSTFRFFDNPQTCIETIYNNPIVELYPTQPTQNNCPPPTHPPYPSTHISRDNDTRNYLECLYKYTSI